GPEVFEGPVEVRQAEDRRRRWRQHGRRLGPVREPDCSMRRAALFLTLVVACGAAARPLGVFPWHLSGNDFVAQVSGQPGIDKWHQSPTAAYQQRYAEGYQAGVVDATQGKLWCA